MTLPETWSVMKRKDVRIGQSANKMKTGLELLPHRPLPSPCLPLQSLLPGTQTVWRPGWALSEPSVRKLRQKLLKQAASCRLLALDVAPFQFGFIFLPSWLLKSSSRLQASVCISPRITQSFEAPGQPKQRGSRSPPLQNYTLRLTIKGRRAAFPVGVWK